MKNVYIPLFILLFFVSGLNAQIVWDNFENSRKGTYGFINGTFIPYNENPDKSGINTSLVAASYSRNPAELYDVIILDGKMASLSDYVSGTKKLSIDVWSPAPGATVQITLENSVLALPANYPTGRHSVYLATTTTSMAWEKLTFNFDSKPDPSVANDNVDRIVLLFQPNTNLGNTWYWDNLKAPELANDPCTGVSTDTNVFMDFECNQNVNFTFSHSGPNFRRIANPDSSMANASRDVATYTRNSGEEYDVIIARTNGMKTIPNGAMVNLDVLYGGAPVDVVVSFQKNPDDGSPVTEILGVTATTGASSQWQTLNYDFSSVAGSEFNQIVILFDPGKFTSGLYYWDNLKYNTSVSTFEQLTDVADFKAFPNPARTFTTFKYDLQKAADVKLTVSDITGRTIATVFDGYQMPGVQQVDFDTDNLLAGVYFYTLSVNGKVATGKLSILK